jgi:beta-galactosidase GanA
MTRLPLRVLSLATALLATTAPIQSVGAEPARYTMTAFTNASQSNMSVYDSADGTRFILKKPLAYTPPKGLIRDPSVMRHTDGWYYVAYTTGWVGNTVGLARSKDLTDWTFLRDVIVEVPGATNSWAPEWFVDQDGSVNLILSVSTTGQRGSFQPYRITAVDASLATWSPPKPLAGLGPNFIDTFVVREGGLYNAFAKNEASKFVELWTAQSLDGPWQQKGAGDWAGWGRFLEGPALTRAPDGAWRIYFDEYMSKRYWFSDSKDGFRSWTPKTELPELSGTVRHFTVLKEGGDQAVAAKPSEVHKITWDKYSLKVDGERVFSWGGEFHPFRVPSPDLWRDILQKMKASGYNTVAIYFDWGYHSPKPGVYDFSGVRDMDRVLTMAKEEGLYVITRAGPYVNAELTRGGFPGWLVNQQARARTDAPEYVTAADEWLTQINAVIARHQLTTGQGTVIAHQIENELDVVGAPQQRYMQWLHDKAKADGITVPVFHNDKGRNGYWVPKGSNVPGTVEGPNDLYAFDGYPGGSCKVDSTPSSPGVAPDWGLYGPGGAKGGASASPNTPGFAAEFGGGWFDYWGSNGDYDCTAQHRGVGYQRVFYATNIANGITLQSFYMTYGGTSWGWLPAPVVFTSYDYGSAIDETRGLRDKARVMKQMGEFIAAVPDIRRMDKGEAVTPSNDKVRVYHNVNAETGSHLYVVVHNPSSATGDEAFTFKIKTRDGEYVVPSRIKGQDSKMLMAGYDLGGQRLVYSTSEIQTHLKWNDGDLALLYGRAGEAGETVLRYASAPKVEVLEGEVASGFDAAKGDLKLTYAHKGLARVRIAGGGRPPLTLLLADAETGQTFWRRDGLLVRGPGLVRGDATKGGVLSLTGDTEADSPLEVFAPEAMTAVRWNGAKVATRATASGSLLADKPLAGPTVVTVPDLAKFDWKTAPGTPEADPKFDDGGWLKTEGRRSGSTVRGPTGQPALDMSAYGFHQGDVWYRGRYAGKPDIDTLTLHYGGGGAGMLQVWLDGRFLGQHELDGGLPRPITTGVATFQLPTDLRGTGEHVISVMVRNNGHNWDLDADDFHKEARGLISASLSSPTSYSFAVPIAWKIQGNLGGEDIQDPVRGNANSGGQYGERMGWHLPGFPDTAWAKADMAAARPAAGTTWYRTSFELNLPKDQDTTLGLTIGDPNTPRSPGRYRVLIFVNGWNMGQFIAHVGPQRTFVLPTGIVDLHGKNTLALAVTSDGAPGDALETVKLVNLRTVRGGIPVARVPAPDFKP